MSIKIFGSSSNRISGKPADFIIQVRANEVQQTTYEISLTQAIIPHTWNTILKDDWFKLSYTLNGTNHTHTIDYGYNSGNYYINDIQAHLQSRLHLYSIGFNWTVVYNKQTNLFIYTHTALSGLSNIQISFIGTETNTSRSLHNYMGFEFGKSYPFSGNSLTSTIPIVVNTPFITLKMNSVNQTNQKNMLGNSTIFHHSNIMCRIPIIGTFASNLVWQNIQNDNSKLVIHKIPAIIQIQLEDNRGHELPLLNNWFFTLQAVPIQNHVPKFLKLLNQISNHLQNIDEYDLLNLIQKDTKKKTHDKNNSLDNTEERHGTVGHN